MFFWTINRQWSIMLVATILATSIMILFLNVSNLAWEYQDQIWKLAYWTVARYAAESATEEAIVNYFRKSEIAWNDPVKRRQEVLYWQIQGKDNKWKILNTNLNDLKVIDSKILVNFLDSQITNIPWVNHVWEVIANWSRLVDNISIRIVPFWSYEFRLTAEERERSWNWSQDSIKKLRLSWSEVNWNLDNAELEIVQARWPLSQKWNIQTHRIQFYSWISNIWSWVYVFWDLWSIDKPELANFNLPSDRDYNACANCFDKYEYIFIFKARARPLILKIEWIGKDSKKVALPDRYVYFKSDAKIWWTSQEWINFLWWKDIYKVYSKSISTKKEIYTDYDSSFDYARNFMIF